MSLDMNELKNLREEIRRMETCRKDRPFAPQTPLLGDEYTKSFLQAAARYNIVSLNFNFSAMTDGGISRLAKHLNEIPELKELNVQNCKAGSAASLELLKQVGKSKIERLNIAQNNIDGDPECTHAVLELIRQGSLKELTLDFNRMEEPFFERIAPLLKSTPLETLSCGSVGVSYDETGLGEALPRSNLKSLNVSMNPKFSQSALQSIAQNLPESKLEFFAAHDIPLNEETAVKMCKGLTSSNVVETRLSFASGGFDAERNVAEALAKMFRSHETRLEKATCELNRWYDGNRKPIFEARSEQMRRLAFREAYRKKVEYGADLPLILVNSPAEAFDAGLLPKMFAVRTAPLTAKECLEKTGNGKTFIESAAAAEILPEIFMKNRWKDAKEMQAAWNAVPEEDRWQLDGRHGRASFQKVKNEVMRSAVAEMLIKNKGKESK